LLRRHGLVQSILKRDVPLQERGSVPTDPHVDRRLVDRDLVVVVRLADRPTFVVVSVDTRLVESSVHVADSGLSG